MANLGINPGTVAAALWVQQREQERQAQLTRSLMSLQIAEAAAEARAQAARDRAQAARDRAINDELRKLIRLQCIALAHSTGSHDERGRPNACCATCEAPLQHDECCTTPELLFYEGLNAQSAGMNARAATCLTRALDLLAASPAATEGIEPARVFSERGRVLEKLGLEDDALADYTAAIALAPSSVSLLEARARLHEKTGNVTEALADWLSAQSKAPTGVSWGQHANRLGRAIDDGVWDVALVEVGQMALLEPPGNAQRSYFQDFAARVIEAVLRRAEGERAEGRLEASLGDCDRIVAATQQPGFSPKVNAARVRTFYLRARALAAMGRSSEALDWLRAAVQADPSLLATARREPDFSTMANSSVGDAYRKLVAQSLMGRLFGSGR